MSSTELTEFILAGFSLAGVAWWAMYAITVQLRAFRIVADAG